jgi:hypothetical protein
LPYVLDEFFHPIADFIHPPDERQLLESPAVTLNDRDLGIQVPTQ